jgi:hypothetical protein
MPAWGEVVKIETLILELELGAEGEGSSPKVYTQIRIGIEGLMDHVPLALRQCHVFSPVGLQQLPAVFPIPLEISEILRTQNFSFATLHELMND